MIGGNKTAVIQIFTKIGENEIGESVKGWTNTNTIKGWLDLMGGDAKYLTFNTKVQESSHIFISDYYVLDSRINAETSRMMIDGKVYDITFIDNPMELNKQLEFYLKFTGGNQ